MSEDLLRGIAAELNGAPAAAARTERMAELIGDTNSRVATESAQMLPFDSSPYAFQAWLAAMDKR